MSEYYIGLLIIFAFSVAISLIWFGIHYFLKRKENNGANLSEKEKEWMSVSKFTGYIFLVLPILAIIYIIVEDKYHVFENIFGYLIAIFIGIFVILPLLLKKGKF